MEQSQIAKICVSDDLLRNSYTGEDGSSFLRVEAIILSGVRANVSACRFTLFTGYCLKKFVHAFTHSTRKEVKRNFLLGVLNIEGLLSWIFLFSFYICYFTI